MQTSNIRCGADPKQFTTNGAKKLELAWEKQHALVPPPKMRGAPRIRWQPDLHLGDLCGQERYEQKLLLRESSASLPL